MNRFRRKTPAGRAGTSKAPEAFDISRRMTRRAALLGTVQLGVAGVIGWRMKQLQIDQADQFRLLAEENRINMRLIPPARGLIFDRSGVPLAVNEPIYRIVIVREAAGEPEEALARLSAVLPLDRETIDRVIEEMRRTASFVPVTVRDRVSWDDVARVTANAPALPGITAEVGLSRHYPNGADTAHVVGYVGPVSEHDLSQMEKPRPAVPNPQIPHRQDRGRGQAGGHAARPGRHDAHRGQCAGSRDARARPRRGDQGTRCPAHARCAASGLCRGPHRRRERGRGGHGLRHRRPSCGGECAVLRPQPVRARHLGRRLDRPQREPLPPAGQQGGAGCLSAGIHLQDDRRPGRARGRGHPARGHGLLPGLRDRLGNALPLLALGRTWQCQPA
ncbi:Cell division protein FtsI/penicillin-binding protein 2 [Rubellimicrobium thermophilum DSM 16684]|uniref:beta-lactamase n=1 Tax=Rubellimicrobium thermophilum DSM 16684 TaxID=1123069 RepID=S9SK16_9RHOB|nr:Cell division protein FtsI/penicillin-binding protein 2 [Rubellimicrobium thermophilum DSM 16684]